jgi:predicted nucleic acid-binding protein
VLVVDASLIVTWSTGARDLDELAPGDRCAPALMWSEARSALHERVWRNELGSDHARRARARIDDVDVEIKTHARLAAEAWRIADELGWAKTYDAEYVALASLLGCRLVTVDGRLRRGADRLGYVVGPTEL